MKPPFVPINEDYKCRLLSEILNIFDSKRNTKEEKKLYKRLVAKFSSLMENWGGLRPIRSLIEDVFKLAKKACNMKNLHRYTMFSVKKYCSLAVFFTGIVIASSINDKKTLQRLAESYEKKHHNVLLVNKERWTHNCDYWLDKGWLTE